MRSRAAGFTLLEVLVSLLLLAAGLLGAASMQLAAAQARQDAALLSLALQAAADMADQLRANPAAVAAALDYDFDAQGDSSPAACLAAACDSAELAQQALSTLQHQVRQDLPGGRARICRDHPAWPGGALRWGCSGAADAPLVIKVGWRGRAPHAPMQGVALSVTGVAP